MPLWRKETSYSGTVAMTKVFAKHEMRTGMDFVRLELNHRQAEFGTYGLKGGFDFQGNTTGAVGYTSPGWNSFAALMMGLPRVYAEDTQTEEMTGRENQFAFYVRDRWTVSSKLTVSGGLRLEYYPLMSRVGRGIETLDLTNFVVTLGGVGGQPMNAGVNIKEWYLAPRVGAAYRFNENTVFRAGYGVTKNPLPWSRPMRGAYPFDVNNNATAAGTYDYVTTLAQGIPTVNLPDTSSGKVVLPRGVFTRSPNLNQVDRGTIQQWNVSVERRLPYDIALEVAYVGTATDGGYADLNVNYGQPGLGGTGVKYYANAGTTAVNDWASRTKSRYQGLQMALNRPFKNGLMLKGAYTWSQAKDMTTSGEDGWVGLTWNHPIKYDDNFDIAVFDRTHVFQMGWVYELPFLKDRNDAMGTILGGWQVNGIWAMYSGTPYSIGGTNNAMACQSCGSILINYSGDGSATGEVGSSTEPYWNKADFSQPTGLDKAGFGNTGRTAFRRPAVWNVDLGIFKAFPIGRLPSRDPVRYRERVQPHELGRAEHLVHVAALPDVRAGQRRERDEHAWCSPPPDWLAVPVLALSRRAPGPCRGRASFQMEPRVFRPGVLVRAGGTRFSPALFCGQLPAGIASARQLPPPRTIASGFVARSRTRVKAAARR